MENEERGFFMTPRDKISREFICRYQEWYSDAITLENQDYSLKYGWLKSETVSNLKDSIKAVLYFQKYIFNGKWLYEWEKDGFTKTELWDLVREGFLSEKCYTSSKAYATGKTNFIYFSQKTAKELYKSYRL